MNCVLNKCQRPAPSRGAIWRRPDTDRAREAGWFTWDDRAPVWFEGQEIHGMVLCPEHRQTPRGQRLERLHDASLATPPTPSTERP